MSFLRAFGEEVRLFFRSTWAEFRSPIDRPTGAFTRFGWYRDPHLRRAWWLTTPLLLIGMGALIWAGSTLPLLFGLVLVGNLAWFGVSAWLRSRG